MTALEKRFAKACKVARARWTRIKAFLLAKRPGDEFGLTAIGKRFNVPRKGDIVVFNDFERGCVSAHVVHSAMNRQGSISAVWVGVDARTIQSWTGLHDRPAPIYRTADRAEQQVFPIELISHVLQNGKWIRWTF